MSLFKKGFLVTIIIGAILFIIMLVYAAIFSQSATKKIENSKKDLERHRSSIEKAIGSEFTIDETCTEYVKEPGKDRVNYCLVAQDTFILIHDFIGSKDRFLLIKATRGQILSTAGRDTTILTWGSGPRQTR